MNAILAQSSTQAFLFPFLLVFPILVFVVFVVWLISKAVKQDRELTHQERIRAIEQGMQPASLENEKKFQHNAYWVSFWIGAGVPIATVYFSVRAMTSSEIPMALRIVIWCGVVLIAVASVISAAVLMRSARPRQETVAAKPAATSPPALPSHESDKR